MPRATPSRAEMTAMRQTDAANRMRAASDAATEGERATAIEGDVATMLNDMALLAGEVSALGVAITGKEDAGLAASLLDEHEALDDPHPDYLTQPEADFLYAPIGGGGGAALAGDAVITLPNAPGADVHRQTVAAPGVLLGMRVDVRLAPTTGADVNEVEDLNPWSLTGLAGAATIAITAIFATRQMGPVNLHWSAA